MINLVPFTFDLTAHEGTRLAVVLDAVGPRWDPNEVYTGEAQAHRMLYASLDADQQTAKPPTTYSSPRECCPMSPR